MRQKEKKPKKERAKKKRPKKKQEKREEQIFEVNDRQENNNNQIVYQITISYLQIYQEQLSDLLEPEIKGLQIR